MLTLNVGNRELNIKYGYEAVVKSKIMKKMANTGIDEDTPTIEAMDKTMELVPELLLVGLQKYHSDEFGYDYKEGEKKDVALDKIYGIIDEYMEKDESYFMDLSDMLQTELLENGFLAKLFRQEVEKAEQKKTTAKKKTEN